MDTRAPMPCPAHAQRTSHRGRGAIPRWLMLLLVLPAAQAQAQVQKPKSRPPARHAAVTGRQSAYYDSNPLKLVRSNRSLYGSETAVNLLLRSDSPAGGILSESDVRHGMYDDSAFDATNFYQRLRMGRRNDRWSADLDARLDYATTRTTEITSFGIVAPNIRNIVATAAPAVSLQYTAVDKVALRGRYTRSTFEGEAFQDYDFYGVHPSYQRRLDPRNSATLHVNAQRYQADDAAETTSTSIGPSLGWIWEYSDNLTASFTAGYEKFTQERTTPGRDATRYNSVFSADFAYQAQQYLTNFTASRGQQPSGNGDAQLLTTLRLDETFLVNEDVSLRGGVLYRQADYLHTPGVNLDSEYAGNAGFAWRLLRELDLTGNYQYTRQKLTGSNGTLDGHTLLIGLTYHPAERAL